MSSVIPASVKKPLAMPIYQGQPTALAEPIIPVEMVSAALTDGAPRARTQNSAPMNCVSRDEAMAVPLELSALLMPRCALPCRVLWLATMRGRVVSVAGVGGGTPRVRVG